MCVWLFLFIFFSFFEKKKAFSKSSFKHLSVRIVGARAEIEMVVMEKCKVSELTEQNITDEEKTAAATRADAQRSRCA